MDKKNGFEKSEEKYEKIVKRELPEFREEEPQSPKNLRQTGN